MLKNANKSIPYNNHYFKLCNNLPKTVNIRVSGEWQRVVLPLYHPEASHDFRRKVAKPARWNAKPVPSPKINKSIYS